MSRPNRKPQSERLVVLLRGVNVGRAKRISMKEFTALLAELGATDIRTVLNSGNAVCTSPLSATELSAAVAESIVDRLGFSSEVIVRTGPQLATALASNPLSGVATDPSRHLVMFLGAAPDPDAVSALAAIDVTPEEWALAGDELHVWLPAGVAESRLVVALTKGVLGVPWTGRNWSTVQKLHDLV